MTKQDFTGIILAGGTSKRIGKDKRFIRLNDSYLIDYSIQTLSNITSDIIIASGGKQFTYKRFACIQDINETGGPIAGLISALRYMHTPTAIVLPCDMPFVPDALFSFFISLIKEHINLIVPVISGRLQPLVGIYAKRIVEELYSFVKEGESSLNKFINSHSQMVRFVTQDELEQAGFHEELFLNINTMDDFVRAKNNHPQSLLPRFELM